MTRHCPQNGFIALISVLIISMVLLFAVFSIGQRGIGTRLLLLDLERKSQSDKLANACMQIAIINVANDPLYSVTTDTDVEVGSGHCFIHRVTPGASQSTIETYSIVPGPTEGAVTNLRATIDSTNGTILSFEELPTI